MLRPLLLATCLTLTLSGCIFLPHYQQRKNVNTALAAACVAARLGPCTIQPSAAEKSRAIEADASAVRAQAQRDSTAANEEAARRSSCLTDEGPRLPVSSAQCAAYAPQTPAPAPGN